MYPAVAVASFTSQADQSRYREAWHDTNITEQMGGHVAACLAHRDLLGNNWGTGM